MTTEFAKAVHAYVLADRQWPRAHRISHAKMQMAKFTARFEEFHHNPEYLDAVNFWRAVLNYNED